MVARVDNLLGNGLYTVGEAALYARVNPAMMRRWVFGTAEGQAVVTAQFRREERHVSFLDLIQILAIREIRMQRMLPLLKFRQAIATAKDKLGLDYPFARMHCTYLYGEELVIRETPDGDDFVEASGKSRGQRLFPFVEDYLKDLAFGPDGLVSQYRIFKSNHATPIPITMEPNKRFGEPLLPSGYTPLAIYKAITVEGDVERVVKAYGLPQEEVEASYQFVMNHLGKAAA